VQRFHDSIEIFQGAEAGIDRAEIGNVIAEILIGAFIDGGEPYGADAKPFEVIDALQKSWQVALTIPVTVLKRNSSDFVDDGAAPPRFI
jgi:hypothetical protein